MVKVSAIKFKIDSGYRKFFPEQLQTIFYLSDTEIFIFIFSSCRVTHLLTHDPDASSLQLSDDNCLRNQTIVSCRW